MKVQQFNKIVVVVGCQRSGTTLAGQILGAHPDALLIDEPDNLYEWLEAYGGGDPNTQSLWDNTLTMSANKYKPAHARIRPDENGKQEPLSNITHLILKAPNLTYGYEILSQLSIPVSIIYPVRDPRSVVASMMKLRHIPMIQKQATLMSRNPKLATEFHDEIAKLNDEAVASHVKYALIWRIKSTLFSRFADYSLSPMIFKYEDLVADKECYSRQMAKHVGLVFDEQMLAHESVYRGFGPGMTERTRPVDSLSIDSWSDRLTSKQEDEILEAADDAVKLLGYSRTGVASKPASFRSVDESVLRAPFIFAGRGGSGTRLVSEIVSRAGVFLGNRLNVSGDSVEWVDLIYEMAINHRQYSDPIASSMDDPWERFLLRRANDVLGYGTWHQDQLWGWKLPESTVVIPELMQTFHKARLVHIVRHPIDSSLRRTHMTSRMNNPVGRAVIKAAYAMMGRDEADIAKDPEYLHNAITWLYQVKRVTDFAHNELPPEQYLEIRYEDLCQNPMLTGRLLMDFLGFDNAKEVPLPKIDLNRMRNYEPSDPRAEEVWALCRDTALKFGYELKSPSDEISSSRFGVL